MADRKQPDTTPDLSLKRKATAAFVPDSMLSYLVGSLRTTFEHLKDHINKDCAFAAAKVDQVSFMKKLLEELFRYLYLLSENSSDGVVRSSPSYFVDQAFHCLMLDPVLYFSVCDEILNMQGRDGVKVRVLPHDALGGRGSDEMPRKARYLDTLARYKQTFGQDPPLALWTDYSNDQAAVTAELEAQQAEFAATSRPHHAHSRPPATAAASAPVTVSPAPPAPAAAPVSAYKVLAAAAASFVTKKAPTASVLAAAPVAVVPKAPDMKEKIKLRVEDMYGDHFETTMTMGEKFKSLASHVAHRQGRKPKDVELRYKALLLTGEMQPFSLNMRDGDVVICSGSAAGPAIRVSFYVEGRGSEMITAASLRLTLREMCDRFLERAPLPRPALGWTFTRRGQAITDFTKSLLDIGMVGHETIVCTRNVLPVVAVAEPVAKPAAPPAAVGDGKVTLTLRDRHGYEMVVRLKRTAPLRSLFVAYAGEIGVAVATLSFVYNWVKLEDTQTPHSAGMKDGDRIDVSPSPQSTLMLRFVCASFLTEFRSEVVYGRPLGSVLEAAAAFWGKPVDDLRFTVDGSRVLPEETPQALELNNEDIVDAVVVLKGC